MTTAWQSVLATYTPDKRRWDRIYPWIGYVLRPASFPITVPLWRLEVTANQVTALTGLLGLLAFGLLFLGAQCAPLAHALLDALVDDFLPIVEEMDDVIGELEERVLADPDHGRLQEIRLLRHNVLRLRRMLSPQRDVINRFARGEFSELVRHEMNIYFRDIYDHIVRVEGMVEALREMAEGAFNTYLMVANNRMQEVMKVLAIVAAVFLPLTLIPSIYGANFENIPELKWEWGYFGMLGAMAVVALGLIAFFRWRRWF